MCDYEKAYLDKECAKVNSFACSYRESFLALIALEKNPNVNSVILSKRLHKMHIHLMDMIREVIKYEVGEPCREDLQLAASLMINGWQLNASRWDIYLEGPDRGGYENATFGFYGEEVKLEISCRFVLGSIYSYDECYQGEEMRLEDYRDEDLEAHIRSIGLVPEYQYESTCHSREVVLYGKKQ